MGNDDDNCLKLYRIWIIRKLFICENNYADSPQTLHLYIMHLCAAATLGNVVFWRLKECQGKLWKYWQHSVREREREREREGEGEGDG